MKKVTMLSFGTLFVLAACGNNGAENNVEENNDNGAEAETQEMGNENPDNETAENTTEEKQTDNNSEEQEDLSAEEVLEEAIALYDDIESLYFEVEGEIEQSMDEENMPEGEMTITTTERQWDFIHEGEYYNRLELETATEGEEDGEEFAEEEPVNYTFTDLEDPDYTITYEEGDIEAVRFEQPVEAEEEMDMTAGAAQYEQLLENAQLTMIGEEEVNGYASYRIEAEEDEAVTSYWFDVETFYEVKSERESEDTEESLGAGESDINVIDYELNPEFDESLFEAPNDVDVVDGEFEDTL